MLEQFLQALHGRQVPPPSAVTPSLKESKVKVYVMYGLGDRAFSAGMEDSLAVNLRKLRNVECPPTVSWTEWRSIVEDIAKQPLDTKIAIIGHSMGGNACTWIQNAARRSIDLLVAYDPTVWSSMLPLEPRVKNAILYHDNNFNPLTNSVGHANLTTVSGWHGKLSVYQTEDAHVLVDDDMTLHARTINAVKSLVNSNN